MGRAWWVLAAWVCAGCASSGERQPGAEAQVLVKEIRFEGLERFSEAEIEVHLHLQETSWVPLTPDHRFDEALLAVDRRRIEALYEAHGLYEARVVAAEVTLREEAREADLRFVVEEGPATQVRALRFVWPDGLDEGWRREVEAAASLSEGAPFEVPGFNDSLGALRLALQRRGHPLAQVTGDVEVFEGARQANVTFALDPGPHAVVRAVRVEGLAGVPLARVEPELRFAIGEPCTPALLAQVEAAVKGLRVFHWVTAAAVAPVEDGQIDLVIKVGESEPQTLGVGGALSIEATRWQEELRANYTHTNLFGDLTRLDLGLVAGWAQIPGLRAPDAHGPVVSLRPWLTRKGLFEDYLVWTLRPALEVNVLDGYQFWSPSTRLGVSRWFGGHLRAELSHALRFVDFFQVDPRLDPKNTLLGRDFQDPFLLSFAELQASAWFVDSFSDTQNGVVLELTYDIAGGALQGDYDFQRWLGSARGYWRPWERLQVAARVGGGAILPYGEAAGAPVDFKFYLGGANSLRGWGARRLSPQVFECGEAPGCRGIPVGGLSMVQGNLELRLRAVGPLWVVGFLDMGDVQAEASAFVVEEWNYAAGPGLRADSPLGIFRLDLGFRLNDPGVYPDEPTWAAYFGVGETF
jgi:outer membrane translocation and assembly module TamA